MKQNDQEVQLWSNPQANAAILKRILSSQNKCLSTWIKIRHTSILAVDTEASGKQGGI